MTSLQTISELIVPTARTETNILCHNIFTHQHSCLKNLTVTQFSIKAKMLKKKKKKKFRIRHFM